MDATEIEALINLFTKEFNSKHLRVGVELVARKRYANGSFQEYGGIYHSIDVSLASKIDVSIFFQGPIYPDEFIDSLNEAVISEFPPDSVFTRPRNRGFAVCVSVSDNASLETRASLATRVGQTLADLIRLTKPLLSLTRAISNHADS